MIRCFSSWFGRCRSLGWLQWPGIRFYVLYSYLSGGSWLCCGSYRLGVGFFYLWTAINLQLPYMFAQLCLVAFCSVVEAGFMIRVSCLELFLLAPLVRASRITVSVLYVLLMLCTVIQAIKIQLLKNHFRMKQPVQLNCW